MTSTLIYWDIYEIQTKETPIHGVMLRGRIRKLCLEKNRNVLVENTQDKENVVRFAIPSKENPSFITNYLCNIFPDVFVNKVEENIPNPVLSKLKVNITKRYTL